MDSLPAQARAPTPRQRRSSGSAPLLGEQRPKQRPREWSLVPTAPRARHTFGMGLLGLVVVLWVSSSFLTHAIFADDSYSKPYLLTYITTATFCLYLLPSSIRWLLQQHKSPAVAYAPVPRDEGEEEAQKYHGAAQDKLSTRETMRLSAEFCLLWFIANYFGSYCLKYTSVASTTILSSTSSMFTLILGSILRVERFSYTKLFSVLASLVGIALISTTDLSPDPSSSSSRTPFQIFIGDSMALLSAFSYGLYITLLKVRVGDESRVDMQQFFGFVGLFNVLCLWPGLFILHATDIELFELPTDGRVWGILAVNAGITLTSDFCWAYAMLLTTPLVVTVGLSLTIPLALCGQMVLLGMVAGVWYWVGAVFVFVAFWLLNHEEAQEGETGPVPQRED